MQSQNISNRGTKKHVSLLSDSFEMWLYYQISSFSLSFPSFSNKAACLLILFKYSCIIHCLQHKVWTLYHNLLHKKLITSWHQSFQLISSPSLHPYSFSLQTTFGSVQALYFEMSIPLPMLFQLSEGLSCPLGRIPNSSSYFT